MLNIGIIGTGVMGAGHARFIRDHVSDAQVVALSDISNEKINSLADEINTVLYKTQSPEELMNDSQVDAVIIASPDEFHSSHLELAIQSRKPTLCEKPIATKIEAAREIAQKVREYEHLEGRQLIHFGFMRRFDPAYRKVREIIESGKLGQPLFIRPVTRNFSSTGATTTGLYTNIAIHDFDVYRWMFKSDWLEVNSHYPKQSTLSQQGLADPLIFTAKMANGILMVADIVAFNNYGFDARFEILCEKGSIEVGTFGDVIIRSDFEASAVPGGQLEKNWMPRFEAAYIEELRAWTSSVISGEPNLDLATVEDALAANEACQLGVEST